MTDLQRLANRVEGLERKNRLLTGVLLTIPLLAVVGWQGASDTLRVRHLEVVDERGVPLVTLGASRYDAGGSIVLRDKDGEKRGWWEASPQESNLSLNSSKPDGTNDVTLGMNVGPKNARMAIISPNGALLSANMEGDVPKVELYNAKGAMIFGAPWKK
jgi:hypothetical protein